MDPHSFATRARGELTPARTFWIETNRLLHTRVLSQGRREPRCGRTSNHKEAVRRSSASRANVISNALLDSGIHSGLVLQALFGTDTLRFGGMLGVFTFL